MLDILLSNLFLFGVVGPMLIMLLALIIILPAEKSDPQQWRVIEPAEQITTVEAKRIEVKR